MRFIRISFITAGITGILSAVLLTPEFVSNYISPDNNITAEGYEAISQLRLFSFLLGCLFLLTGFLFFRFPEKARNFIQRPIGTVVTLIIVWILIAFINLLIKKMGMEIGTPDFFPFSEFYGPRINFSGLPYSALFLTILFISLKYSNNFSSLQVWIIGLVLIVLGNLAQGGIEEAFYKPINAPFYYLNAPHYQQYYHDAIKITDWREWLHSFNANQVLLLSHSRTHPPFAVLLYYYFIKLFNNNILFLAGAFTLLSSLSVILISKIMKVLELSKRQCSQFALLFSVIPAYNIYSAVSLDGVIISFSTLFLLGVLMIVKNRISLLGIFLFMTGIILANLLTFLALFLVATAGLIALREIIFNKSHKILLILFISLLMMLAAHFYMLHFYGYNHAQAFLTVSNLEPKSLIFSKPLMYVMTRLENIAMFAIFLSFGVLSVLCRHDFRRLRIFDLHDRINAIFFAGIIPLVLFLLMGGLYTGEIARIFLFIYPFFFLILRKIQEPLFRFIIIAAGVQTIIMQTLGGYFW